MVRLGFDTVCLYPSTGIMFDSCGSIVFKGNCCIGNNSFISIGSHGKIVFDENFSATTSLKIACYNNIGFGKNVSVGWNCLFIDTDFHSMKFTSGQKTIGYGKIVIGNNNWIGNNCVILKNTETPDYITIAAGTLLSSSCLNIPEKSIIANERPIKIIGSGVWRDRNDDIINYGKK